MDPLSQFNPDFIKSEEKFLSRKNILSVLVVLVLLLVIPFGVNLIQKQQIFKGRAAVVPITFTGDNVKCDAQGNCSTATGTVSAELRSPLGPPVGSGGGGSCSTNDACTTCILNNRPDLLPFYQKNGWDISCSNQPAVVQNWCGSVDPTSCTSLKSGTCKTSCQ